MEILSLITSVISIFLGIVAIIIAVKEAKKSDENYRRTENVLKEIEFKSMRMDQSLQTIQNHLLDMIKIAMERMGQPYNDLRPISKEEIDEILNAEILNDADEDATIIEKEKDMIERKKEYGNE